MKNNTDSILYSRVVGTDLSAFYENICPRLNLPKPVAKKMLLFLEKEGHIEINWRSSKGARYYIRRRL
ncbi:MAG: hypothetical protein WC613_05870 [Candidatus Aenigmatarchaeota archaeon]